MCTFFRYMGSKKSRKMYHRTYRALNRIRCKMAEIKKNNPQSEMMFLYQPADGETARYEATTKFERRLQKEKKIIPAIQAKPFAHTCKYFLRPLPHPCKKKHVFLQRRKSFEEFQRRLDKNNKLIIMQHSAIKRAVSWLVSTFLCMKLHCNKNTSW